MGRWNGPHPWRAIIGWIAFVAICFFVGNAVGTTTIDESQSGTGESGRASRMLDAAGFTDQPGTEMVLVQSRSGSRSDGATIAKAHPDLRAEELGDASVGKALDDRLAADFRAAEFLSVLITLVILIVAFGALLAAGIPVLLGLTAVFSAIGLVAVTSAFIPTSESAPVAPATWLPWRPHRRRAATPCSSRASRWSRRSAACSSWALPTRPRWPPARSSSPRSPCSAR